jgi:hypothetical protein
MSNEGLALITNLDLIPGAAELVRWFGRFPRFHDAYVLAFQLNVNRSGLLKVHGWNMTPAIDDAGYFLLDKDFVATFVFAKLTSVQLENFEEGSQAILFDLDVSHDGEAFLLTIESSYGFEGTLRMKELRVDFSPGKPAQED